MGTRNLTCVVLGGEYKVAQYGQWDGYPSGQGLTILNFLRDQLDRELFLANLAKTYPPTEEQVAAMWAEFGHDVKSSGGFVNYEIAQRFGERYPTMHRNLAGAVLEFIQKSEQPVPLQNAIDFAADSLFCEYAYVADFDKGTFEVFKGFNQKPLTEGERFFGFEKVEAHRSEEYHPVKHLHTFQLDALPTDEEFLAICEPRDEDEEE
jgi:hypothetical protein